MLFNRRNSLAKRRATSGMVSTMLLFAMIFTVGASYFLFVINGESQYEQALANRGAGLQSQLGESLTVSPASGTSNHLVFTATNVGGLVANMTDVFVLDPSGAIHTYGVGFGASNTSPTLPSPLGPAQTSVSLDTGLAIVSGTYKINVLTQRGNLYTATYPVPLPSYASSTGSLKVDLSSFRWVQLTGASSMIQQAYVPNCNAALCSAGFSSSVTSGDVLVYAVGWPNQAPPATPTDTRGDTFTLGPSNSVVSGSNTYYSYIWYAIALSSGVDTISAQFTSGVTASVSIYELSGYSTVGVQASYGTSPTGSTSPSVTSFTPSANSFVIGNLETASGTSSFSPGPGYTLANQFNCNPNSGCSEYHSGVGSATTAPFTLSSSTPWVESAISFASVNAISSGVNVGGYPSVGVPNQVTIAFQMSFTNQDPQGRSITLWPQSAMTVNAIRGTGDEDQARLQAYYIIDGLNAGINGIIAYNSTKNFVTLAPGVKTTLYFGARFPLSSSTSTINSALQSLFMAFFALTGQYSDQTLYGQTIPYPVGIVTSAKTSPGSGGTGAVITVTGSGFNSNVKAFVGWIDSTGKISTLTKFTSDGNGNVPSGITFQVPSGAAGYYTIVLSDYVDTTFTTFQHT